MATAIYIGLLMNVKSEVPARKSEVEFFGNLFFAFAIYDLLVLIALFTI